MPVARARRGAAERLGVSGEMKFPANWASLAASSSLPPVSARKSSVVKPHWLNRARVGHARRSCRRGLIPGTPAVSDTLSASRGISTAFPDAASRALAAAAAIARASTSSPPPRARVASFSSPVVPAPHAHVDPDPRR
eukprot:30980-Pelagococcus_subviridis.AAC.9